MENVSPSSQSHTSAGSGSSPANNAGSSSSGRKRSGSGGSILSKFPFLRTSDSKSSLRNESRPYDASQETYSSSSLPDDSKSPRALQVISQQHKTRKRKGSLRKVALLGRGAARERRELKPLAIHTAPQTIEPPRRDHNTNQIPSRPPRHIGGQDVDPALAISDLTPRPSMDGYARGASSVPTIPTSQQPGARESYESLLTSPTISYTSTTDDEDALPISTHKPSLTLHPGLSSISSGSDSYFETRQCSTSIQRRRSVKHAKSPLSLQGLSTSPLPTTASDEDHDYDETEWWGWVVLVVTWTVFIIGMGSCVNIWSWSWDVGTAPYAPPELEDDPTLPIVGYYPALIILTCIMAWVWVVVAWIGMKYFRHAKISGD